jgi:hypothetical protein
MGKKNYPKQDATDLVKENKCEWYFCKGSFIGTSALLNSSA